MGVARWKWKEGAPCSRLLALFLQVSKDGPRIHAEFARRFGAIVLVSFQGFHDVSVRKSLLGIGQRQDRLKYLGREIDVIVDAVDDEAATCRTVADAPEIDGALFIDDGFEDLTPGDIVRVRVDEAGDYDLWGQRLA